MQTCHAAMRAMTTNVPMPSSRNGECRAQSIDLLRVKDDIERSSFENRYRAKSVDYNHKIDQVALRLADAKIQLEDTAEMGVSPLSDKERDDVEANVKKLGKELAQLEAKKTKSEHRLQLAVDHDYKGLAEELSKKRISGVGGKIQRYEVMKSNAEIKMNKSWLGIANSVGKIAVITLALALTALNWWSLPFALSLITLGCIVDSIGYTKIIYDEFVKEKKPLLLT